jgi:hypothetical protein
MTWHHRICWYLAVLIIVLCYLAVYFCPNIGAFPPTFALNGHAVNGVDCSGYVRAILWYATFGGISPLPDGSYMEEGFFVSHGLKPTAFANCQNSDGFVRVCVHLPNGNGGDPIGHIWLAVHGHSIESYGGHGPGQRPWNSRILQKIVDDCFVVGHLV